MARRRRYTEEERRQRREADKRLREAADALLEDPQKVEAMARAFAPGRVSDKIAGYSERNQALLYSQAEAKGIRLTDVATVYQWSQRGRRIRRGETGLRIVAPKGREQSEDKPAEQGKQETGFTNEAAEAEQEESIRFRMVSVFDISQTRDASEDQAVDEQATEEVTVA